MAKPYASHSYVKSLGKSKNHVRYIAFRSRENIEEQKGLFSQTRDHVDVNHFLNKIDDKKTSHPNVAVIHKVLFSMSGDEWDRSGFVPGDYQDMIRTVMEDWQLKTGKRIDWVAAEHRNPDHPHCHVVIKATYTDKDGVERRLEIKDSDRKFFRESFQNTKNRTRGFELEYPNKRFKQIDKSRATGFFDQLVKQIKKREFEEEMEREKQKNRNARSR